MPSYSVPYFLSTNHKEQTNMNAVTVNRVALIRACQTVANQTTGVLKANAQFLERRVREDKTRKVAISETDPCRVSYNKPGHPTRTVTTLGKVIRRIYGTAIATTDSELDVLCRAIFGAIRKVQPAPNVESHHFALLEGDAVMTAYENGPGSCMQERPNQVQMYCLNPDKVKLLEFNGPLVIGKQPRSVHARALVWHFPNMRVLDRIYMSIDGDDHKEFGGCYEFTDFTKNNDTGRCQCYDAIEYIHEWCRHNNIIPRSYVGEHMTMMNMVVKNTVPYMDWLKYAWSDDGQTLNLRSCPWRAAETIKRPWFTLEAIAGTNPLLLKYCPRCNQEMGAEYTLDDESMCRRCYERATFLCALCGTRNSLDGLTTSDVGSICPSCAERYELCAACGCVVADRIYLRYTPQGDAQVMCRACHGIRSSCSCCGRSIHNVQQQCGSCKEFVSNIIKARVERGE